MRIGVLVGNPKPKSRTRALCELLAAKIDPNADTRVLDLADYANQLFNWPDDNLAQISADMAGRDLLIVGSPTYKATYSGLLKAFLDRYPNRGLDGAFAIPLMTVASCDHNMAPEVHLRPLLVELGAILPTPAIAFLTPQFDLADKILGDWVNHNERSLTLIRAGAAFPRPIQDSKKGSAEERGVKND